MFNNPILKKRLAIAGVLVISLFVASAVNNAVFVNNTPGISPDFVAGLAGKTRTIVSFLSPQKNAKPVKVNIEEVANVINKTKLAAPPANVIFKDVTKGVAASEVQPNGQTFVKVDQGHEIKYRRFQLDDGRVIDILDLTGQ